MHAVIRHVGNKGNTLSCTYHRYPWTLVLFSSSHTPVLSVSAVCFSFLLEKQILLQPSDTLVQRSVPEHKACLTSEGNPLTFAPWMIFLRWFQFLFAISSVMVFLLYLIYFPYFHFQLRDLQQLSLVHSQLPAPFLSSKLLWSSVLLCMSCACNS